MTRRANLVVGACCIVFAAGCGTTSSSSSSTTFKGVEHEVAQVISNLETYSSATTPEAGKICKKLLAKSIVTSLGGDGGCEQALKKQLSRADSLELTTKSVKVQGDKATANVETLVSGKKKVQKVSLAKEGSAWKITALE